MQDYSVVLAALQGAQDDLLQQRQAVLATEHRVARLTAELIGSLVAAYNHNHR